MTVQRYPFHRVNGGEAVFDLDDRWVARPRALTPQADRVAQGLTDDAPGMDWTD